MHTIFKRGSAVGARSESDWLLVTSCMKGLWREGSWPIGLDDLMLWQCWVKDAWI